MNIFYLEWNSFCNEDMFSVLQELGHTVIKIPFAGHNLSEEEVAGLLDRKMQQSSCDFLFSFNYFPKVSNVCKERGIRYVSWVYDSPHIHAYSYTVLNPCNYIFLFDYAMYEELHNAGIKTVYYLPLAIHDTRLARLKNTAEKRAKYAGDVSFVGSLYSEPKHRVYDKFQNIGGYARGYLDGLIQAQLHVQGYNFLQEMLTPDIVAEMQKAYPTDPNAQSVLSPEGIYADYVLARQVTAIERREILEMLGCMDKPESMEMPDDMDKLKGMEMPDDMDELKGMEMQRRLHRIDLYTHDSQVAIPGVRNRGLVDYYDEMPYVFMNSKINLNITLRSIKTGIPLRALDIMGCGGFLLTNYQAELFEYFEAGKDFVYYTDQEDLLAKVDYYLEHEEERKQIAENGCRKVREQHNMRLRVQHILDILAGERE